MAAAWLWGTTATPTAEFDTLLAECTSDELPTPDLKGLPADLLQKCLSMSDMIRSGQVKADYAVNKGFKRRIVHTNPNVQLLALLSLDIAIKNSGDAFLREVASGSSTTISLVGTSTDVSLVDALGNLARGVRSSQSKVHDRSRRVKSNTDVRNTTLRLLQNWATAFESKPHLAISQLVLLYRRLRVEGCSFPPRDPSATAAMIDSMAAPEWIESDVCSRCREAFTMTNRRHHCRNCGDIFDHKCSSKTMPLPHFGIQQDVRVCDGCYKKIKSGRRSSISAPSSPRIDVPNRSSSVRSPASQYTSRSARIQEDDDLQLALRLSLAEAQPSERPGYQAPSARRRDEVEDPELAAAIEASLREHRAPQPSAPADATGLVQAPRGPAPIELAPRDSDALLTFAQMAASRQHSVHELAPAFDSASAARTGLVRAVGDAGRRQQILLEMSDKLTHAVKLYDGLLERQVARHSAYIAPPVAVAPSHMAYLRQPPAAPVPLSSPAYSPPRATFAAPRAVASPPLEVAQPQYAPIYPSANGETQPWQSGAPTARVPEHAPPQPAPPLPEPAAERPVQHYAPAQNGMPPALDHAAPRQEASLIQQPLKTYTAASFPSVPTANPWSEPSVPVAKEAELIEF